MSESIVRQNLLTAVLEQGASVERVHAARIELAPSQRTGVHLHPCPVVGCVLSGAIRFQVDGAAERILERGDAFFEPAHVRIAHFDNTSDREPAAFVAFYLLTRAEERLIVMLE